MAADRNIRLGDTTYPRLSRGARADDSLAEWPSRLHKPLARQALTNGDIALVLARLFYQCTSSTMEGRDELVWRDNCVQAYNKLTCPFCGGRLMLPCASYFNVACPTLRQAHKKSKRNIGAKYNMANETKKDPVSELSDEPVSVAEHGINEKALLRKIDGRLLPAVGILYLLSFLDRSNGEIHETGFARIIKLHLPTRLLQLETRALKA